MRDLSIVLPIVLVLSSGHAFAQWKQTHNHDAPAQREILVPRRDVSRFLSKNYRLFSPWSAPPRDQNPGDQVVSRGPAEKISNAHPPGQRGFSGEQRHELSPGVDTAWVRHYASGLAPWEGFSTGAEVDDEGNLHVTGSIATVKYDRHGNLRWATRSVSGNKAFWGQRVKVDVSGNVFVGGILVPDANPSPGPEVRPGIILLKYGPDGNLKWSAVPEVDGAFLIYDTSPILLEPDDSGNVFLASSYAESVSGALWGILLKYSSAGELQWTARDSAFWMHGLACDRQGDVWTMGGRGQVAREYMWTLARYDARGHERWKVRDSLGAVPVFLDLDDDANAYVTGTSTNYVWYFDPGVSLTALYDSNGSRQWLAFHESLDSGERVMRIPRWTGVERGGSAVICGVSDTGMVIVKIDSAGQQEWVVSDDSSWVETAAMDDNGNVIVMDGGEYRVDGCYYERLRKYDRSGQLLWARAVRGAQSPNTLLVDAVGNLLMSGYGYTTVKFDFNGLELWRRTYTEVGVSWDRANAVAVDPLGNCAVGGPSRASETFCDYLTVTYDAAGNQKWFARYASGGSQFYDYASDVAVDASGNVYVTGVGDTVVTTLKYSPGGGLVWLHRATGSARLWNPMPKLILDGAGTAYVFDSGGEGGTSDLRLLSLTTDGAERWVRSYESGHHDLARGIALDPEGNVIVAGIADSSGVRTAVVMKFDALGDRKWLATYGPLGGDPGDVAGVAVDPAGSVYLACDTDFRFVLVKYSPDGVRQWAAYSPEQGFPRAVQAGGDGMVYLTGNTFYPHPSDVVTMAYDTNGHLVWERRFGEPSVDEIGTLMAVDGEGSAYVAARCFPWQGSFCQSVLTVKYSRGGDVVWHARYHSAGNGTAVRDLELGGNGDVFITGYSEAVSEGIVECFTTLKYVQISTGAGKTPELQADRFALEQNYPNPFNPSTIITYALPFASDVRLIVYDLLGREVSVLVNGRNDAGVHEVRFDGTGLSSGVYLYRLQAGEFVETRKLVLLQ